VTDFSDIN